MSDTLTGWYRNICNNLIVEGGIHQADSVQCRLGGNCTQCSPQNFTVEHGTATVNPDAKQNIGFCSRRDLVPSQPIKL